MAIQFARAFGAEVTAFSTSADKEEEARALGAHHFVNSRESKALKEIAGTIDFILSTINADQDWGVYLQALRPTGTLCFVGVPPSAVSFQAFPLISGLRSITGSPIGSPHQLREMIDVAARHGVKATDRSLPHGQSQRRYREGQKEQGPLPRRPRQLALRGFTPSLFHRFTALQTPDPRPLFTEFSSSDSPSSPENITILQSGSFSRRQVAKSMPLDPES
jgi:hypothetical protein